MSAAAVTLDEAREVIAADERRRREEALALVGGLVAEVRGRARRLA